MWFIDVCLLSCTRQGLCCCLCCCRRMVNKQQAATDGRRGTLQSPRPLDVLVDPPEVAIAARRLKICRRRVLYAAVREIKEGRPLHLLGTASGPGRVNPFVAQWQRHIFPPTHPSVQSRSKPLEEWAVRWSVKSWRSPNA
jgi:hypothetical protein